MDILGNKNNGYMFSKKKAQAAVETAIFSVILITLFAGVVNYAEEMNYAQMGAMEAFRRGLSYADTNIGAVSYSLTRHRRSADLSSPGLDSGQSAVSSGSANIYWLVSAGKMTPTEGSFVVENRDGAEKNINMDELSNKKDVRKMHSTTRQENTSVDSRFQTGQGSTIDETSSAFVQDNIQDSYTIDGVKKDYPAHLEVQKGIYDTQHTFYVYKPGLGQGKIIKRQRHWNTRVEK